MISGIVVASRPEDQARVRRELEALDYADIHFSDPRGRLVVTVDAPGIEASMERVAAIGRIPEVLAVSLAEYWMEAGEVGDSSGSRRDAESREEESKLSPHDWRRA
jgi:nitrate reductase NapAB chaperone NapD